MRVDRVALWSAVSFALLTPVLMTGLVLTFARWAEGVSGRLLRVESFTPFGIPLYATVLVACLVGLVLARRHEGPRSVWAVLSVVAVVGLAIHLAWFSTRILGPNPPPAEGAEPLVVMSANLYAGNADGAELMRVVAGEGVDVLVAIEVTPRSLEEMAAHGLGELLPYRIGGVFNDNADGTMVFSRLPLGEATAVDTGHQSWQVGVGDDVSLMAVHPYSPTVPSQWEADHATIAQAADAGRPDLIVGDFNATLDHQPMQALAANGWRSVAERTNQGWQPTWPNSGIIRFLGRPVPAMVQIDHVLVGPRFAAISIHTVDLPGTDHRAVIATVARR